MLRTRLMAILGLLVVASMILSACGPAATTEAAPTQAPQATEPPQATEAPPTETLEPTAVPVTRKGAWVDEIVFSEQPENAVCIAQLQAGDLDSCPESNSSPDDFKTVAADSNLSYSTAYGLNFEILFNPIPTFADGRVNPFGVAKIREAVNMLIDRNYIIQEIFGGLGAAKYSTMVDVFPDYARYIDVNRALEAKYAYNPEKADETISAEMEALGATKNADGKWEIGGNPVTLIFIIRTEDERTPIGDYVASQLESIGFTVDRQYKARSEASPIWANSDPVEGQWNMYTGGWINNQISRDDGTNFGFYDTDFGGCCGNGSNYMTADVLGQEYYDVATKLWNNDFSTLEERGELFKKALDLSAQLAYHVWIIDTQAFIAQRNELTVASDLAAGVSASPLYPFTVRLGDTEGGTVRMAPQDNFIDPWNPVGGSNWVSDGMVQNATMDQASLSDPYTGLAWPQRAESLTVTAKEGLPISKSLDWVTLNFVPDGNTVPTDAWADWDATAQKFITVGEKFPDGVTSNVKVTWTYPADMFDTVAWHDGSPLSAADFVMNMILAFDTAKPESAIYDETTVANLEAFLASFKAVQIESTDPLVISSYTDAYQLDAETFGLSWFPSNTGSYAYGTAAWHNITPAILAEANGEIAFTIDKATAKEVEWTNFIDGPTLENQKTHLAEALAAGTIPYAPTLSEFITAEEATARYENLTQWVADRGHFWIGTGPFYLEQVFTTEGQAVLKRNENFPDLADKWSRFSEPKVGVVDVSGDGQVLAGQEATFDVFVTFKDEPYPADEIELVKYLVFDANNTLVASGDAELVSDGQYAVTLGPDVTSALEAGAGKIEVAVASKLVSIPFFSSFEFVTVK
jgi:peptide/nickel transport system substrate-binding protein